MPPIDQTPDGNPYLGYLHQRALPGLRGALDGFVLVGFTKTDGETKNRQIVFLADDGGDPVMSAALRPVIMGAQMWAAQNSFRPPVPPPPKPHDDDSYAG